MFSIDYLSIFLQIFELLVKLRADSRYRLGVVETGEYSPYTYLNHSFEVSPSQNSPTENDESNGINMVQLNYISPIIACRTFILALEEELGKLLKMKFRNLMAFDAKNFNCK